MGFVIVLFFEILLIDFFAAVITGGGRSKYGKIK